MAGDLVSAGRSYCLNRAVHRPSSWRASIVPRFSEERMSRLRSRLLGLLIFCSVTMLANMVYRKWISRNYPRDIIMTQFLSSRWRGLVQDMLHPNINNTAQQRTCITQGLQGSLKDGAMLTMVAMPKAGHARIDEGVNRIFQMWKALDDVNIIVLSSHCSVLLRARAMGLPVIQVLFHSCTQSLPNSTHEYYLCS